jgi:hypothetical protein
MANGFDAERVAKVAQESRSLFAGMPGLRSKVYAVDELGRRATSFYVWDSTEQAKALFTPELTARVTGLYGVAPTVQYSDVLAVVDNTRL